MIEYFLDTYGKKSDTVDLLPLLISFMKMSIDGENFICLCQSHKPQKYSKESHKVRKMKCEERKKIYKVGN